LGNSEVQNPLLEFSQVTRRPHRNRKASLNSLGTSCFHFRFSQRMKQRAYLDIQPTPSIPEVHPHLLNPQLPSLVPFSPGFFQPNRSRWHPHRNSQYFLLLVTAWILGNVKQRIAYSPTTSNTERDPVPIQVKLWSPDGVSSKQLRRKMKESALLKLRARQNQQ
jgi:hypothetical protein